MKKVKIIILCLLILGILALVYSFIEPYWVQTKEITISNKDIPASFNDTKIIFITDIHHGPFFSIKRVKSLVDKVNGMQPDIIILGGDYVHADSQYIKPCFAELKNLKADIGKYGVLGNHDHWEGAELSRQGMKDARIDILDNKAVWINKNNEKMKIGGVGDLWEDKQDLAPTINNAADSDYVILLSHNPDYVEQIRTKKVDLVLSGHTHGGQITLFGIWSPFTPITYREKYTTGIVNTKYTKAIISNGIGLVGYYPMRFFARPQIIVIRLKSDACIEAKQMRRTL